MTDCIVETSEPVNGDIHPYNDYFHKECFNLEDNINICRELGYTGNLTYEALNIDELFNNREGIMPHCIICDEVIDNS